MIYLNSYKLFESIDKGKPKIGDFVICKCGLPDEFCDSFIENSIGQLKSNQGRDRTNTVQYSNIPRNISRWFMENGSYWGALEIIHWSKNKEELEPFISAKKFGI